MMGGGGRYDTERDDKRQGDGSKRQGDGSKRQGDTTRYVGGYCRTRECRWGVGR
jgi:hypothetical protein